MGQVTNNTLLSAVTSISIGPSIPIKFYNIINYIAKVTGTGAVSATILIQVSYDEIDWITWGTLSPTGTTSAVDTLAPAIGNYRFHRANLTAISGTGAAVTVISGGSMYGNA